MSLTPQLVSELCRRRLDLPDGRQSARFIFLIPDALKSIARKIAANPNLRDLLTTDKAAVTANIATSADGTTKTVDLKPLYITNFILKEYLDCGQMYVNNNNYPLQKLANAAHGSLAQYLTDFAYWFTEGDTLNLINTGDDATTVSFAVPYYPATLAALPESAEIETMLIDKIVELANPGSDVAEDGEK